MEKQVSLRKLRQEFPDLPFRKFYEIIEILGLDEPEALREILNEESEKAQLIKEEEERRLRERFETITASMLHRKLKIPLPPAIDAEHALAYLVHGFAAPASARTFVGENYLPKRHLLADVRNKLGPAFDKAKFEAVESHFLRCGVVIKRKEAAGSVTYSLNVSENARAVTPEGRQIIVALKRFLYEYRPNRR